MSSTGTYECRTERLEPPPFMLDAIEEGDELLHQDEPSQMIQHNPVGHAADDPGSQSNSNRSNDDSDNRESRTEQDHP